MKEYSVPKTAAKKIAPLVSVIIPLKNGLPEFQRVVDMLQKQKFEQDFEVIIIDSGSKDGSLEIIPEDSNFRVIEIDSKDFGHGRTRNLGVEHARGEFCAFLTHDATPVNENWLQELVKPLQEDPEVAGVFGRHIAYETATPFTKWELETHFAGLGNWPVVLIDDAREYARNQGLRQAYHFYSDNSSCLRKSVWQEHPYPDVEFAEDQIWAKRIIEAGYKKAFAWDSVVYHSHDYSVWERLQRSYDEARALNTMFGYKMGDNWKRVFVQSAKTTARDLALALRNGWFLSHPVATLTKPLDNLARQIGYHLGTRQPARTHLMGRRISRDVALKSS